MTLHEAIKQVLENSKKPLKPKEIAIKINEKSLYKTGDGNPVSVNQIHARINNYTELFHVNEDGSIKNANKAIRIYEQFAKRLSSLLERELARRDIDLWVSVFVIIARFGQINKRHYEFKDGLGYKKFFKEVLQSMSEKGRFRNILAPLFEILDRSYSEYTLDNVYKLIVDLNNQKSNFIDEEEFAVFFNNLVNDYYWQSKFNQELYSTPKSVSSLIARIITPKHNDILFDPFAGKAGLLCSILNEHRDVKLNIDAGDLNDNCVLLGSLNLAVSSNHSFEYKKKNALYDWDNQKDFADWVIMNPPFGTISNEDTYRLNPVFFERSKEIAGIAVQVALFHAKPSGKALIIVPESFIFSDTKGLRGIRRHLVENRLLSAVISLPAGIFSPYSGLKTSLIIIDKNVRYNNSVYFYDASKINPKEFDANIDDIVIAYNNKLDTYGTSTNIHVQEIAKKEYDLSISKYFTPEILFKKKNLVALKEIVGECFSGNGVNINNINNEEGPFYINISDLPSESSEIYLSTALLKSHVSDTDLIKGSVRYVPENSILLAKVGTKMKPAIFNSTERALCNNNILILQIDSGKMIPEYLLIQLNEGYFQEQLQKIRRGVGVPSFSQKDFLELFIETPPINEQKQLIASVLKEGSVTVEQTLDEELYNVVSRVNHELKTPVSTIGMDAKSLLDFFKSNNGKIPIDIETLTVPLFDGQSQEDFKHSKIGALLNRVLSCVSHAQEVLGKAEETLKIGKTNLSIEATGIKRFIETAVLPFYVNVNCEIVIEGKESVINFDKYQMKALFMNLIDNAIKHGFNNMPETEDKRIRISLNGLTNTKEYFEIIVANNGRPFGEGFTKEQFFSQGITSNKSAGAGFGGYHIRKIVENHRGLIELSSEEETAFTEYKVQFKIYLPAKK